jgi:hypothetical protein
MTFLVLLCRRQQCHTLEHKRAFLTWITRPERKTPAGLPATAIPPPLQALLPDKVLLLIVRMS